MSRSWSRRCASLGHEVVVVGPGFYERSGFGGESKFVAWLRLLLPGAVGELVELAYNVQAYRRLARACEALKPDLIYERYNLYYLAGAWLARRRNIRFFLEVNGPLAEERTKHGGLKLRSIGAALRGLRMARRGPACAGD